MQSVRGGGLGLLVAVGAGLLALAAPADAATLVNQNPRGAYDARVVPSFDLTGEDRDSQAADDFTIAPGRAYTLTSIYVRGWNAGMAGTDTGNVYVYEDNGGPGQLIYSERSVTLDGGTCLGNSECTFTAPIADSPSLPPGTYWISVQTSGPYGWHWATTEAGSAYGSEAEWQNPGGGVSQACPTWRTLTECDMTDASAGRDLAFTLFGDIVDSRFTLAQFSAEGRQVKLGAAFPVGGSVEIRGKGVKRTTLEVSAGRQSLDVKLSRDSRRKLNQGKKARLMVTVTFTATGGVPYELRDHTSVDERRGGLEVTP